MTFAPAFYRTAAVCSVFSAVTTLLLIFLPELFPPAEGFAGRMARVHEPAYQLRAWAYLIHPFLVLAAALAVGLRIRRFAPVATVVGLLGFALWAFTEAGQQTLTLFAFDRWREAYGSADATMRVLIETNTLMYDGLWDAMYFLLLIGFAVGNLCFGLALVRSPGFTRLVGVCFLAAFALTLTNIGGELRWMTPDEPWASWSYPAIQPLGRALIGLWLWIAADETGLLPRSLGVRSTDETSRTHERRMPA